MSYLGDQIDPLDPRSKVRPVVRFGAIGEAWALIRRELGTWVLAMVILLIGFSGLSLLAEAIFGPGIRLGFRQARPFLSVSRRGAATLVQSIIYIAINGFFLGGMVRMAARQIRGQPIKVGDLFSVIDVLPELLLASFLVALAMAVGFALCVLPGFLVGGLLMFVIPLVVDGRLRATEAIRRSWRALEGQWLSATLFHLVAGLLASSGFLLCGIGILITAPLYAVSVTVLYRDFFSGKFAPSTY
ncbi:MAG: hypothetical protein IRY99_19240 [Isosphaeraceae bacterium]|nr:hypothetical protein [Isosphaeraceae bacterium]